MKIFIVIPAYNENERILKTLNSVLKNTKSFLVVVDDGSKDKTCLTVEKYIKNNLHSRVVLIKHLINLGKGAAMKTGIEYAIKEKADCVIFIDADGQHNPKHLPIFEKLLLKNKIVFGYRDLGNNMPFIRRFGNKIAIQIIKKLFMINRKDLLCGYFGFKTDIYQKIIWASTRYGVETEIAAQIGKKRIKFCESKIDTIYIDKYKGVTMFDAFKILYKIPFWYLTK